MLKTSIPSQGRLIHTSFGKLYLIISIRCEEIISYQHDDEPNCPNHSYLSHKSTLSIAFLSVFANHLVFFWLKQVFAEAQRNDNRNIQAGPAFVLRQFIKATRHSSVPWKWKTWGWRRGTGLEFWINHQKPSKVSSSRESQESPKLLYCPMLCLCQDFPN